MPLGHWFIAIDAEKPSRADRFKKNVGSYLSRMRESEKASNGPERICAAGEPEHDSQAQRKQMGGAMILEALIKSMVNMCGQFFAIKQ